MGPKGTRTSPATPRIPGGPAELQLDLNVTAILELSPDAMVAVDSGARIVHANAQTEQLFGFAPDELRGHGFARLWDESLRGTGPELLAGVFADRPAAGPSLSGEFTGRRRDGTRLPVHVSARAVDTPAGPLAVFSIRDMSERARTEQLLRRLADRDALTGLLNRRRFEEELAREVARAARYRLGGAVLVLDLDHFKYVNDTLGHHAGDQLIRSIGDRLAARLRQSDVVARLGGDEFAAILPQAGPQQAQAVAADVLRALRDTPFLVGRQDLRVTASIGIALIPREDRVSADELLVEADVAMYDAKDAGGDRWAVYSEAGRARMDARHAWAERIRTALEQDVFTLHAQPVLDLRSGHVDRYELLLRMTTDDGGIAFPADFLGTAERVGLITRIDEWVVRRAVAILVGRPSSLPAISLDLNVSAASLAEPAFPRLVEQECRVAGVDPARLGFEVTETAAIAGLDAARECATRLRALGCRFGLDDFGTGFSTFHYVKHLPLDILKIDGDFVGGLARDRTDQMVVQAIAGMARGLGIRTVGEYVADDATVAALRRFGVDAAQGFHLGKPEPVAEALAAAS